MRKIFSVLFALVLVLSFSLVTAVPAAAATLEVGTGKPYGTIQAAIDAADPGDIILVGPGTYDGNLIVYKQLTIRSTHGAAQTIIDASKVDKSTFKNAQGHGINYLWAETYDPGLLKNGFLVIADNVTIDGFKIINATHAEWNRGIGIILGSIDTTYAGFVPSNIDEWGGLIGAVPVTVSGVTIQNNIIEGASEGVCIWSSDENVVKNNVITGTATSASGCGIRLFAGAANNVILYNTIEGSTSHGICLPWWPDTLEGRVVGTVINYNNISGNAGYGVNADVVATVDATLNWWGTTDGSLIAAMVSANVDYDPWLDEPWTGTSVGVNANTPQIIAISVTPTSINFGSLYPGQSSSVTTLTISNIGTVNVGVTTSITGTGTGAAFFTANLYLGHPTLAIKYAADLAVGGLPATSGAQVVVPPNYPAVGAVTGTLIFWAQMAP